MINFSKLLILNEFESVFQTREQIMKNQIQDVSHKTNKASVISLVTGIIAFAPYLVWGLGYLLLSNNVTETIGTILFAIMVLEFFIPSFIIGLVFGLTSLISGSIAIMQIKNRRETETGYRLGIVGILLGILILQRDFILLRDFDPYYETLPLRGFSVCGCNLERVRLR